MGRHDRSTAGNRVRPARLRDLPAVLQAVARGALHGHFNPALAQPRVLPGLLWQLLGVCLLRRLWQPAQGWRPAWLWVASPGDEVIGFVLAIDLPEAATGAPARCRRLAMVAVDADRRGQGWGRHLVAQALDAEPRAPAADALCQPGARAMQRLLCRLGFSPRPASPRQPPGGGAMRAPSPSGAPPGAGPGVAMVPGAPRHWRREAPPMPHPGTAGAGEAPRKPAEPDAAARGAARRFAAALPAPHGRHTGARRRMAKMPPR